MGLPSAQYKAIAGMTKLMRTNRFPRKPSHRPKTKGLMMEIAANANIHAIKMTVPCTPLFWYIKMPENPIKVV